MSLDRYIALLFVGFCAAYGYTAFFVMDAALPPFMKFQPFWPSTFPKILSIIGVVVGLGVLLGVDKPADSAPGGDLNFKTLDRANILRAVLLLALMMLYAIMLRPAGFLASTSLFLIVGALILGERRYIVLILVAVIATGAVWYLVQQVLGIVLRPLPGFLGN